VGVILAQTAETQDPQGQEHGMGFLGRGTEPPPHQLEGLGERCTGVRGHALAT